MAYIFALRPRMKTEKFSLSACPCHNIYILILSSPPSNIYHFFISYIITYICLGVVKWHYSVRCILSGLVPSHVLLVQCADWGLSMDELHGGQGPELMQVIRYGLPVRGLYPRPYCLSLVHFTCLYAE